MFEDLHRWGGAAGVCWARRLRGWTEMLGRGVSVLLGSPAISETGSRAGYRHCGRHVPAGKSTRVALLDVVDGNQ